MARSDYDFINLSLEHELNEWLAEVVTRKLRDSFYVDVSWDALNVAYSEHPEWFSEPASGDED